MPYTDEEITKHLELLPEAVEKMQRRRDGFFMGFSIMGKRGMQKWLKRPLNICLS